MKKKILLFVIVPIFFLAQSCQKFRELEDKVDNYLQDPNPTPLEETLKKGMPIGYAASKAMAAVNERVTDGVQVLQMGNDYPKSALLHINIGDDFPIPFSDENSKIIVAALFPNEETAVMSMVFSDFDIQYGQLTIYDISTFPVQQYAGELLCAYADIDINKGSDTLFTIDISDDQIDFELNRLKNIPSFDSTVSVEEVSWYVTVNNRNTISEMNDDIYSIAGAGQYVELVNSDVEILQVIFVDVKMKPECILNPLSGVGFIKTTGVSEGNAFNLPTMGTVGYDFHDECDGRAYVFVATGNYIRFNAKTVKIDLSY